MHLNPAEYCPHCTTAWSVTEEACSHCGFDLASNEEDEKLYEAAKELWARMQQLRQAH